MLDLCSRTGPTSQLLVKQCTYVDVEILSSWKVMDVESAVWVVWKCDSKPPSVEALLGAVTLSNLAHRWKDAMTMLFRALLF